MTVDLDLGPIKAQLITVKSRLKAHYFADPDDCVWAIETVGKLVDEVEYLRELRIEERHEARERDR